MRRPRNGPGRAGNPQDVISAEPQGDATGGSWGIALPVRVQQCQEPN